VLNGLSGSHGRSRDVGVERMKGSSRTNLFSRKVYNPQVK